MEIDAPMNGKCPTPSADWSATKAAKSTDGAIERDRLPMAKKASGRKGRPPKSPGASKSGDKGVDKWTVRGVPLNVRQTAIAEANRRGLTVGDWLTEAAVAFANAKAAEKVPLSDEKSELQTHNPPDNMARDPDALNMLQTVAAAVAFADANADGNVFSSDEGGELPARGLPKDVAGALYALNVRLAAMEQPRQRGVFARLFRRSTVEAYQPNPVMSLGRQHGTASSAESQTDPHSPPLRRL